MKTKWQEILPMSTKIVTVSHRIGERLWLPSSKPNPFISY